MSHASPPSRISISQQKAIVDNVIFQAFARPLKPAEHRTSAVDENFPLEQPVGNRHLTNVQAGFFYPVDAEHHFGTTFFAPGDFLKQLIQVEFLSAIQNRLAMTVSEPTFKAWRAISIHVH